jgi:chloramphenicol 3-O phosphotransferase
VLPIFGKSGIIKFSKVLHECPVLYVGVTCPLEELRRREKERGERQYEFQKGFGIGLSESQLPSMASQDEYDIIVDTYANSSEECADKIIEMLSYPEKFTAFNNFNLQRTE